MGFHKAIDSEKVQEAEQILAGSRTAVDQLSQQAVDVRKGRYSNETLQAAAEANAPASKTLQFFPTELPEASGQVHACVALVPGAPPPAGIEVVEKHGMRFVPLHQEALGEARVATWADMPTDRGRRFREVSEILQRTLPELFAACVIMQTFQDESRLLKFHMVQPEINTAAGIRMNPDWTAETTGFVWTLSLKHEGRECFKIACPASGDGEPYIIPFNPISPFYNKGVAQEEANQAFADAHYRLS